MTPGCAHRLAAVPALIAAASVCVGVRAQPPWTPEEVRRAEARQLGQQLERLSSRLDGVEAAEAQVTLPAPLGATLDGPPPTPVVGLHVTASQKHWERLRNQLPPLATGLIPGLVGAQLTLDFSAPSVAPAPTWSSVGPFHVARESARPLRAALGLLLVCSFGLALLLLRYARARLRSPGERPDRSSTREA